MGIVRAADSLWPVGVADIQRARILAAMVQVAAERGFVGAAVGRVVAQAGVSRRTFYELFGDSEDCFLAAFDESIVRASRRMLPPYHSSGRWHERIRASLEALLAFLDSDPYAGRLIVVETLGGGPRALERRVRLLEQIATAIDAGRREAGARNAPPAHTAEGVVGAVLSMLHNRMVSGYPNRFTGLTNPLMSIIVLPYLGTVASFKELERPVAPPEPRLAPPSDPLIELDMRLTHRTMRVLLVIGKHPGRSNREVGHGAGVEDQGQISKLLSRLKGLGLIQNAGGRHAKGGRNAWKLTDRGSEVWSAITVRPRSESL